MTRPIASPTIDAEGCHRPMAPRHRVARGPPSPARGNGTQGDRMAELVVIGYDSEATAESALETLGKLQKDLVVDLAGAAVVTCDAEGKYKMSTPTHATGAGAASGALWGMIF